MSDKYARKLQRMGSHSYVVNIPKEFIDSFRWQERQKLTIEQRGNRTELIIRDWKPHKSRKP